MNQPVTPSFVIAHRGASASAPENTLSAIRKTADYGCRWIEVDAMVTADTQVVLHHDDTIDRCSNGSGLVLAQRLEQLQDRDFGSWFNTKFADEKIPTLQECGALCSALDLGVNLEIKVVSGWETPTAEAVCASVAESWPDQVPLIFSSFDQSALITAKVLLPDVPRAYLATVIPKNWQQVLEQTGSCAMHCGDTEVLTEASVQQVLKTGIPLRVYTVDDPARAQQLKDWGVQSIFTNRPEEMLGLV